MQLDDVQLMSFHLDAQIFLTIDVIALVIQAAGGGIASGSAPKLGAHIMLVGIVVQFGKYWTPVDPKPILIWAVSLIRVFLSVAIIIYSILGSEFIYRIHHNKPFARRVAATQNQETGLEEARQNGSEKSLGNKGKYILTRNMKLLLVSLGFSTLCLFIRSIYRLIEVSVKMPSLMIFSKYFPNLHLFV